MTCPQLQPTPVSNGQTPNAYSQTMRRLRVCIRLLTALLLASVAHAVTDGLTPGLVLGLVLTTLLLLAALGLWRTGSRRNPGDDLSASERQPKEQA
jgi:hypothetical protein